MREVLNVAVIYAVSENLVCVEKIRFKVNVSILSAQLFKNVFAII